MAHAARAAADRYHQRRAVLGGEDSFGAVEPGKLADLVLLDADPLEDIRNTQRIRAIVANGRYYDRAALDGLLEAAVAAANAGS